MVACCLLCLPFDPKDGDSTSVRNVGDVLLDNTALRIRRQFFIVTILITSKLTFLFIHKTRTYYSPYRGLSVRSKVSVTTVTENKADLRARWEARCPALSCVYEHLALPSDKIQPISWDKKHLRICSLKYWPHICGQKYNCSSVYSMEMGPAREVASCAAT
jgi:hypothetical protein